MLKRWLVFFLTAALVLTNTGVAFAGKPVVHFGDNLVWTEINYGAQRPWLDPTCFDDDHTGYGITTGYLNAGESVTFRSPKLICFVKIQRGLLSFHKRLSADLSLVDYGGHLVPNDRLVFQYNSNVSYAACNTDLGSLHVDLDPTGSETGEPADYAYWTVKANKAGTYTLEMVLNEPWWSGGESSTGYCLHDGYGE